MAVNINPSIRLPTKESKEFFSLMSSILKLDKINDEEIISLSKYKYWNFADKSYYKYLKSNLDSNIYENFLLYSLFYNEKDESFYKLFKSEFKSSIFSKNNENLLNFVCLSGDDYLINYYKNDIEKELINNQNFIYSLILAVSKNNNHKLINIIEKIYDLQNNLTERQYEGIQRTPKLEDCLKNDFLNNTGSQILIKVRRSLMGFWVLTKSPNFVNQFMCGIYESNINLFNYLLDNPSIFNEKLKLGVFKKYQNKNIISDIRDELNTSFYFDTTSDLQKNILNKNNTNNSSELKFNEDNTFVHNIKEYIPINSNNETDSNIDEIMENIYIDRYLEKEMTFLLINKEYSKLWNLINKYNNHEKFFYVFNEFKNKNERILTKDDDDHNFQKIQDYATLSSINIGSNFIEIKEKYQYNFKQFEIYNTTKYTNKFNK